MNLDREELLTLKDKERNGYPCVNLTPDATRSERERIERETEEFLARGGKIQEVGATKPYEHKAVYSISRKNFAGGGN